MSSNPNSTNLTPFTAVTPADTTDCHGAGTSGASYSADRARILARLRRMEGQVRGVQRMIEEDKYCVDVLTQLSSVIAAARAIGLLVLEDHVRGCVINSTDPDATVTELTDAIERFTRSVG